MYSNFIATVLISTFKLKCTSLSHTPSVFSGLKIQIFIPPFEKMTERGPLLQCWHFTSSFVLAMLLTYTHQHDLIQC